MSALRDHSPAVFEPSVICPTMGADSVLGRIEGCVPIYVCAKTCAYSMMFHRFEIIGTDDVVSVVLDDQDVILGDVRKKVEAVVEQTIEGKRPKLIVLVSTCLPEIIGIPLEALAKRLGETHGVRVIASRTECLKCPNYREGEDTTLAALCASVPMRECRSSPSTVNLVGFLRTSEQSEIKNTLRRVGVDLNATVPHHDLAEFERLPAAAFNVAVTHNCARTLAVLQDRFGLARIEAPIPTGFSATRRFFTAIAAAFGRDDAAFQAYLTGREAEARKKIASLLPLLAGRRIAVFGSSTEEIPLALSLRELGADVVRVSTVSTSHAVDFDTAGLTCPVQFDANVSDDLRFIDAERPDLVFGSFPQMQLARRLGIPATFGYWVLRRRVGFDGMVYLAQYSTRVMGSTVYGHFKGLRDQWLA